MDELTAKLLLIRAPLDGAQYCALLEQFGSAAEALHTGVRAWRNIEPPPRAMEFLAIGDENAVCADYAWLAQANHHLLCIDDAGYPALLHRLSDAPMALFVSGSVSCLSLPQLAMVGTRNPTPYGRDIALAFAKHLTHCGLAITSGLAGGIDAASHRGALNGTGHTIAVFGTGLDIIYPRSSEALAHEIEQRGALVSEFPPGTLPRKYHFPQRNRIISGLALGTLVVEAATHSGSLITARLAGDQGREVFAIPGSIHNPLAKGCHQLIRQGAKLVDSAEDILNELGTLTATLRFEPKPAPLNYANPLDLPAISVVSLDKDYKILLDALGFEPMSIDQLVVRSGLKADAVASMLMMLELEEHIASFPGGMYVRTGVTA